MKEVRSQLTCPKQIHFLLIRMHTAAVSKQTRAIAYKCPYFEHMLVPSLSTAESTSGKKRKNSIETSFCKIMAHKKDHMKMLLNILRLSFIHWQSKLCPSLGFEKIETFKTHGVNGYLSILKRFLFRVSED